MNRSLYIVLCIAICFPIFTVTAGPGDTIRFMTYNIRLDHRGDGEDNWKFRSDELVNFINDQQPDFLGVQEALLHQLEYIMKGLEGYEYIGGGRDNGKRKGEFSAIIYDRNSWALQEDGMFWLSETPASPSQGWDAKYPRVCTWGVFRSRDSRRLAVFNTHFDHQGEKARLESVRLIEERIADAVPDDVPVVLMGDFNAVPTDPPYGLLTRFLIDSRGISSSVHEAAQGTFNGFDPEGPYPRRIDHIFVDEMMMVHGYRIEAPRTSDGRHVSDHFPVIVDLEILQF